MPLALSVTSRIASDAKSAVTCFSERSFLFQIHKACVLADTITHRNVVARNPAISKKYPSFLIILFLPKPNDLHEVRGETAGFTE